MRAKVQETEPSRRSTKLYSLDYKRVNNFGLQFSRLRGPTSRESLSGCKLCYARIHVWSTRTRHSVNVCPAPASLARSPPPRLAAPNLYSVMTSLLNSIKSAFVNQAPNLPRYITAAEAVEIDQWLMGGPEKGAFSIDQVRSLPCSLTSPPADSLKWFRTAHGARRIVGCSSSRGALPARPAGGSGRERDQAETDKRARPGLLRTGQPGRRRTRRGEAPL